MKEEHWSHPAIPSRLTPFYQSLRQLAARHRIRLNRVVLAFVLIILSHPLSRIFFAVGFVIALLGALLRLWARLTCSLQPEGLITAGPYSVVRHPMYLGTLLEALGMWMACFSFRRPISFALLGLGLGAYFLFVYK